MVGEKFFQNLAAEISSSFIETCPTHRRFIAAWRFPVVMTALDLFFAVRKDTTPVVDYLKNPLAALLYSSSTNCWSRSQVAKKSFNQLLYPSIR